MLCVAANSAIKTVTVVNRYFGATGGETSALTTGKEIRALTRTPHPENRVNHEQDLQDLQDFQD